MTIVFREICIQMVETRYNWIVMYVCVLLYGALQRIGFGTRHVQCIHLYTRLHKLYVHYNQFTLWIMCLYTLLSIRIQFSCLSSSWKQSDAQNIKWNFLLCSDEYTGWPKFYRRNFNKLSCWDRWRQISNYFYLPT